MRPLELVLLLGIALGAVGLLRLRRPTAQALLLALAAFTALAGAQAVVEGSRWQLVPGYAASALLLASLGGAAVAGRHRALLRRTIASVAVLLTLLSGLTGWALPVDLLPEPPGPAAIGTTTVLVTDDARPERYGPDPGDPRQLVVQAWYPADPDAPVDPAPWVSDVAAFGDQAASEVGLPPFGLRHLELVTTSSTEDAPTAPSADGFPVVVLSHGWTGFRTIHTDLAESLASRGYVVLAIDHTHGALATLRPDGEVVPLDPDALPDAHTVTPDVYEERSRALVATFAADIRRSLDALADGAFPGLAGAADLTRVAFVGHSTGGGGAVLACSEDPRCGAVVGFDPWVNPVPDEVVAAGLRVPLLSLRSEEWTRLPNDVRLAALHGASGTAEGRLAIAGTLHRDFTLIPTLSPLSGALGLRGETPTTRTREIVDTWTAAFLDHHLRGLGDDPLQAPPAFEEVEIAELR